MVDADEILLENIIRRKMFYHVCQPIYVLQNWSVFGYEALLRCRFFQNPEFLFQFAKEKNRLFELDVCSAKNALSFAKSRYVRLFVNLFPSTVLHSAFPAFLQEIQTLHRYIVFEINETEKIEDMGTFRKGIMFLKNRGYAIALDDFGKGEATLQAISEIEPDFVKLDRYFAAGLSVSEKKQEVIRMLVDVCRKKNMKLILEGIEEPEDLAIAKALGVHLGQGYLLGKPLPM